MCIIKKIMQVVVFGVLFMQSTLAMQGKYEAEIEVPNGKPGDAKYFQISNRCKHLVSYSNVMSIFPLKDEKNGLMLYSKYRRLFPCQDSGPAELLVSKTMRGKTAAQKPVIITHTGTYELELDNEIDTLGNSLLYVLLEAITLDKESAFKEQKIVVQKLAAQHVQQIIAIVNPDGSMNIAAGSLK